MPREPVLLIGYDVEKVDDPSVVRRFLRSVRSVHEDLEAPCTFFLLGRVVENNWRELKDLRKRSPFFDYEQHTYSHVLLKTVCMDDGKHIRLVRGGSPDQIEDEVAKTNRLLEEKLGVECWGITGPWGYYRGLCDRPDLLEILSRNGIRFTRTWARNEKDWQPVPFDVQPFTYEPQGFPGIVEFPLNGWQDVHWRELNGWENLGGYLAFLKQTADDLADRGIVWGYGSHDWSSIRADPELSVMRAFIQYAKDLGFRILDYRSYYLELVGESRST